MTLLHTEHEDDEWPDAEFLDYIDAAASHDRLVNGSLMALALCLVAAWASGSHWMLHVGCILSVIAAVLLGLAALAPDFIHDPDRLFHALTLMVGFASLALPNHGRSMEILALGVGVTVAAICARHIWTTRA